MADLFFKQSGHIDLDMLVKYKDCGTHYAICQYQEQMEEFFANVSLRRIHNVDVMDKFGNNPDINTGTDPEDLWDGGGIWQPPSAACKHNIKSTDSSDSIGGTGARTEQIFGLNSNHAIQTEMINMDGENNVPTAKLYSIIYRKIVRSAGNGESNAGTLTATSQLDGTVTAQISPGKNQTLMAIYQIPASKMGLLSQYFVDVNDSVGTGRVEFDLLVKPPGEVWQTKHHRSVQVGGDSRINHKFTCPRPIDPKSLVKLGGIVVSNNNTDVSGGFEILLVDI